MAKVGEPKLQLPLWQWSYAPTQTRPHMSHSFLVLKPEELRKITARVLLPRGYLPFSLFSGTWRQENEREERAVDLKGLGRVFIRQQINTHPACPVITSAHRGGECQSWPVSEASRHARGRYKCAWYDDHVFSPNALVFIVLYSVEEYFLCVEVMQPSGSSLGRCGDDDAPRLSKQYQVQITGVQNGALAGQKSFPDSVKRWLLAEASGA